MPTVLIDIDVEDNYRTCTCIFCNYDRAITAALAAELQDFDVDIETDMDRHTINITTRSADAMNKAARWFIASGFKKINPHGYIGYFRDSHDLTWYLHVDTQKQIYSHVD